MDLIDFAQIMDLLKVEPGHGLIQSLLLFMIWISSRGVRKELIGLKASFDGQKVDNENRFETHEARLTRLETVKGEK